MNSKLSLGVLSVLGGYIFVCDNLCNRWTIKMQNKPNFNRHSSIDNRQFKRWLKMAKNGALLDNFGSFLDKFGVIVDKLGVVLDNLWSIKTPINRIFNTKNKGNSEISHQFTRSITVAALILRRHLKSSQKSV